MAVKPLTNKRAINKETINRANQVSTRNLQSQTGNRSKTYIPGQDFTKSYAITLKDIDTAVLNQLKHVMKPSIQEANEIINVPIFYGNRERWSAVRKSGVLKSKLNLKINKGKTNNNNKRKKKKSKESKQKNLRSKQKKIPLH